MVLCRGLMPVGVLHHGIGNPISMHETRKGRPSADL